MSTPFLIAYAHRVVHALLSRELIEIDDGRIADVVQDVAAFLAGPAQGFSVISSTSKALIRCPYVAELYAEDDDIKTIVDGLQTTATL